MLTHIYVKNFVLIDQVALDFSDGMSVFTGETGAGKSLPSRCCAGSVHRPVMSKKAARKQSSKAFSTFTMMRVPMRSCENRDLIWTGKI